MLRAGVNEMNVKPVDLGHEMRERVQPRFALQPVVVGFPVTHELLHRLQPHPLRVIRDGLPLRPPGRREASPEVVEGLIRKVNVERTDGFGVGWLFARDGHARLLG